MPPLPLESTGLAGARSALAAPVRRGSGVAAALACATLMAAAATALCAVVLLGVSAAPVGRGPAGSVHGKLLR